MVRSDLASSGVMFSIDTESGHPDMVFVTGAWGLGENVVQVGWLLSFCPSDLPVCLVAFFFTATDLSSYVYFFCVKWLSLLGSFLHCLLGFNFFCSRPPHHALCESMQLLVMSIGFLKSFLVVSFIPPARPLLFLSLSLYLFAGRRGSR
jgi:hypothetical protein